MDRSRSAGPTRRTTGRNRPSALLLLALAGFTFGCDSATGPPPLTGEIRIAHAAPGAGAFEVSLRGTVLASALGPGQSVRDSVPDGDHAIVFSAEGSTIATGARTFGPLIGVVLLMEGTSPGLRSYPHTRSGTGAVLKLINAAPDRSLTIELDGAAAQASTTLEPAEALDLSLPPSRFQMTVSEGDAAQPVELGSVELIRGRSFVVVYPGPDPAVPWQALIF